MAIKKSELYSSLWEGCDALRGGMDASQYKDYVLTILFIKYISDRYAGGNGVIKIPEGASFQDMVALKGQKDIGDRINKHILRPVFSANRLEGEVELVDFNDDEKLGKGKEKVDLLSRLISIFENPALNFKNNRAEDDDLLGDAYEYLMRHFATESGKSKGQFYTPSEVSRILARIINIEEAASAKFSIYDPTCGSGSLLLKVADEAPISHLSIYGQEKDNSVKSLAVMNMWMHGYEEVLINKGNTIARPGFTENGKLKRFDRAVANPPFSIKNWSQGIKPEDDQYDRFINYGIPPEKNGDYAFLLHMLASIKNDGKAAIILPHGVLFRGNAEAVIRQNLIERHLIKGIIGLPANLFYGTGIPACIIVLDKAHTAERKGIFMLDASKGYKKDGNKNRLRERDIHRIVDIFTVQKEVPGYARLATWEEIAANEYNLNIPRYIDSQEAEDLQDLHAHLHGGIPDADLDALAAWWEQFPGLRSRLLRPLRPGYSALVPESTALREQIAQDPDFKAWQQGNTQHYHAWKAAHQTTLRSIDAEGKPKVLINTLAEDLLDRFRGKPLLDPYALYQHLMDYWNETMRDDAYLIAEDGWVAKPERNIVESKQGHKKDKGWKCDLVPKDLVIGRYFREQQRHIEKLKQQKEATDAQLNGLYEEHSGEEALFDDPEISRVSAGLLRDKTAEYYEEAFLSYFPEDMARLEELEEETEALREEYDRLEYSGSWTAFGSKVHDDKGNLDFKLLGKKEKELNKWIEEAALEPEGKDRDHPLVERRKLILSARMTLNKYLLKRGECTRLRKSLTKKVDKLLAQGKTGEALDDLHVLAEMSKHFKMSRGLASDIRTLEQELDDDLLEEYPRLDAEQVRQLVIQDKWTPALDQRIGAELEQPARALSQRLQELHQRYAETLSHLQKITSQQEAAVLQHLKTLGIA